MKRFYLTAGAALFLIVSVMISASAIEQAGWNALTPETVQGVGNSNSTATSDSGKIIKSGACGDNLTYLLDDAGVLTIRGSGDMYDYYDKYEYRYGLNYYRYSTSPWGRNTIRKVIIEPGVTSVGSYAFFNCSSLTNISIPESVIRIGQYAFLDCGKWESISIPGDVISIGSGAFDGCGNTTSIIIPDNITAQSLGKANYSFRIPGTNYDLHYYSFDDDNPTGLEIFNIDKDTEVFEIPDRVTRIGDSAFSGCTRLANIIIPNGATEIGSYAFSECNSLENITIPDSVRRIGYYAFSGCNKLTGITIPGGVDTIDDFAFSGCTGLTNITIPDSVTKINGATFGNSGLTWVEVSGNNNMYSSQEGVLFNKERTELIWYPSVRSGSYDIPDGVTKIGNNAFSGNDLTSVTIPDSVTSIGYSAFSDCSNLESIIVPNNVTRIGEYAFSRCSSLKSITLPADLMGITRYTFQDCNAIKYCAIDSITAQELSYYGYSFRVPQTKYDLRYYEAVYNNELSGIELLSADKDIEQVELPYGVTRISDSAFAGCTELDRVIIPESVTQIEYNAFSECVSLKNIILPESIKSISSGLFYGCSGLTTFTIPDSVITIETSAFSGCSGLATVTIPDSVTTIETSAFSGCSSLTSIIIPNSVTTIGSSAFSECNSLSAITIPDSVINVREGAFSDCNAIRFCSLDSSAAKSLGKAGYSFRVLGENYDLRYLFKNSYTETGLEISNVDKDVETFTIPEDVTSIGPYAFSGCRNLTDITIPYGVTAIGTLAFYNCTSLTDVTIPESVTSIDSWAFYNCKGLEKALFKITDEDTGITFGSSLFSSKPTIYCYMFTAPDVFFTNDGGYPIVYLDDIRSIVLPDDFRLACGDTIDLKYEVFPKDAVPVTWTSSNPDVLSVENGTVTALTPGTSTVTASAGDLSETVTIEVYIAATGISLDKTDLWLQAKDTVTLAVAEYIPEDASVDKLTWKSSDTTRAIVNGSGQVTTIKPGDVTVTAVTEKGVTASCTLHLIYPVLSMTMEPASGEMYVGKTLQLNAAVVTRKGTYGNELFSFTSSDENIATVDAAGMVTSLQPGTVIITATGLNGREVSSEIVVQEKYIPDLDTLNVLRLPSGLTSIEEEAFAGNACQAVIIPDTCTSIGSRAFAECTNLIYVYIPDSVVNIAADAFDNCHNLIIP